MICYPNGTKLCTSLLLRGLKYLKSSHLCKTEDNEEPEFSTNMVGVLKPGYPKPVFPLVFPWVFPF